MLSRQGRWPGKSFGSAAEHSVRKAPGLPHGRMSTRLGAWESVERWSQPDAFGGSCQCASITSWIRDSRSGSYGDCLTSRTRWHPPDSGSRTTSSESSPCAPSWATAAPTSPSAASRMSECSARYALTAERSGRSTPRCSTASSNARTGAEDSRSTPHPAPLDPASSTPGVIAAVVCTQVYAAGLAGQMRCRVAVVRPELHLPEFGQTSTVHRSTALCPEERC
jgi:hypothetical protein